MKPGRLYSVIIIALAGGYTWLTWQLSYTAPKTFSPCLIKHTIGIACPSCGTTRSVEALAHGEFIKAAFTNPFGYIVALFMIILPLWLLYDALFKKQTLYTNYVKSELILKKWWIAIPLTAIVASNWAWNIYKGL